jgi:hypothetical protein
VVVSDIPPFIVFALTLLCPTIKYISEPAEYFDMLTSDQILVMGINFVSDEMVEMRYQYKEEFVEESGRTNVVTI